MVPPSGSLTFNPSTVGLLSIQSLCICKKCPVVPESAIANPFVCTADAYDAIFLTGNAGYNLGCAGTFLIGLNTSSYVG